MTEIVPVVHEGLGNCSYLVDLGDRRALAVDPSVDLRRLDAAAERRGLRVTYAAETHLHADFVSGGTRLAARGATLLATARGGSAFPYHPLEDEDEVDLGGLTLRALATPGHTPEHVSYLLLDGDRPLGVFTGGSLIVGSAARPDLSGPDLTERLARAQYRSLRRLAALPDETAVYPTHGAGSFCSAPPGAERTTTIGREKAGNPLLAEPDEDAFVARLLGSLGSYPRYFARLPEINRRGPAVPDPAAVLAPLDAAQVHRLLADGALAVDVRPVVRFAAGHVPGALSIALRPQFGTWLGWLVPADQPVVIVRDPDQDPAEIRWQALEVGHQALLGELAGGMASWEAAGYRTRRIRLVYPGDPLPGRVLDVRQRAEYDAGHVPGAVHVELGELGRRPEAARDASVTMCGHGERAMTAASLLARSGRDDIASFVGGPDDWARPRAR